MSEELEKKYAQINFEEAMQQLDTIVTQLENGDVPLEKAIQLFQEGMHLSKICHDKLRQVEQQVHLILEEQGDITVKPFQLEEDFS